jgi:hypothetical protein
MNSFYAVFTNPDPDCPPVFWGAFSTAPDAHTAIEEFMADRPYWKGEDFEIHEFPFGVLL